MGVETLDGDWYRENWAKWMKQNGATIDFVFFNKPEPAFQFLADVREYTAAAIIYQCHDLHHLRLARKAEVEDDPAIRAEAERYEAMEDFAFANSDVLLTFSTVEEAIIRERYPWKRVFTVPLFFYAETPQRPDDFEQRRDLLFVGACSHAPNRDAIEWFCKEVFPAVKAEIPDVTFNVVSAHAPAEISALGSDQVRILGRVSDEELQALYDRSRVVVIPLRFGAGVKGKLVEALHQGVPVVSTSIGLEGISGIDCLVPPRDDAAAFAREVVSLYRDTERLQASSREGSTFVKDRFSTHAASRLMSEILDVALAEAAPRLENAQPAQPDYEPPRLIAFHLPQYHPIPENDEWWGEGFTDWRNVKAAEPQFEGHYQPHVPSDLGYYDMRDADVRAAQARLAREHGIEGFCYYHYWFNGKRLLEQPLQEILRTGRPDFPFCLCWANENWTRRWDGHDRHILIAQDYGEDDDRAHIRSLIPIFRDPRYIRVYGKPLLLVYRTELMPDPGRTAEIWREEAHAAGIGEIYLCRVESFHKCDPRDIGFDAAVEFAPDWCNLGPRLDAKSKALAECGAGVEEACEKHNLYDYQVLADTMMAKKPPAWKWHRCVTPCWDNTARRKKDAFIFHGSDPRKYASWLNRAIDDSSRRLPGEERLVFINAWNEWAEGNHLEPDRRYGRSYLEATAVTLRAGREAFEAAQAGGPAMRSMGQLTQALADVRMRRDELQERLEQREQELEELLNSTSWRITAPMRWLKRRLTGSD
jgi:glycosyltransferase involved in cell wall biosynthesis